jgi:hypothetical protein
VEFVDGDKLKRLWNPTVALIAGLAIGWLIGSRAIWYDVYIRFLAMLPSSGFFEWTRFSIVVVLDAMFTIGFIVLVLVDSRGYAGKPIAATAIPSVDQSRTNYLDSLKTMIAASGVAIAIIAAGLQQKIPVEAWIVQRAAVLLPCVSPCPSWSCS